MNNEAKVHEKYPTAISVHTQGWNPKSEKYESHYRIWPTSNFFETRVMGFGSTREEAWEDAVKELKTGK